MGKCKYFLSIVFALYVGLCLMKNYSPIDVLEIQETNLDLYVGKEVQLTVKGYKYQNGGDTLKEVDISDFPISWSTRSADNAFSVDENGLLEVFDEGVGTVQASYMDKVYSEPLTIIIDNDMK